MFGSNKKGFTLSEVLITLGIIGVVAAMTIPTLMKNYQKKVFETQFKKSVSVISNIIKASAYDLGVESMGVYCRQWNGFSYYNHEECYQAIMRQVRITATQKYSYSDSAVYYSIVRHEGDIRTYNNLNVFKHIDSSFRPVFFVNQLKDGTFLGFCVTNGALIFSVDLNGYSKPNKLGHDIFLFYISAKDAVIGYGGTRVPNQSVTDDEAEAMYTSDQAWFEFYRSIAGLPCNLTSKRVGNGVGCAYYALRNKCPYDNTKTYWECLP